MNTDEDIQAAINNAGDIGGEQNLSLPSVYDSYPLWQLLHEEHGLILLNGAIEDIINVVTPIIEQRRKAESKERYLRAKAAMEGDAYIDGVCYFINNEH